MNESTPWYVAVGDTSVGPVSAELVVRGIQQRKVPPEALVCEVGSAAWIPLASVEEFHAAVIQSYPPPPPGSVDAQFWLAHGFRFPQPAALPSLDDPLYAARPTPAPHPPPAPISAGAALKRTLPPVTPPPRRSASPSQTSALPAVTPPPRRSSPPPQLGALPPAAPPPARRTLPPPSPPPRRSPIPPLPPAPTSSSGRMAPPVAASPVEAPPVEAPPVEAPPVAVLAETPTPPPSVAVAPRASASDIVVDLDIEEVIPSPSIDWTERFQSYFLVGEEISLPDEDALLASLSCAPRDTFQHDEALWNLALCMAYGSDAVAEAAARTFWEVVAEQGNLDRLAWMDRTLLGNGFVPSGIPAEAGRRAHERLESVRPPALSENPPPPSL